MDVLKDIGKKILIELKKGIQSRAVVILAGLCIAIVIGLLLKSFASFLTAMFASYVAGNEIQERKRYADEKKKMIERDTEKIDKATLKKFREEVNNVILLPRNKDKNETQLIKDLDDELDKDY